MKNENVVVKKNASEHLAPSGRGWHAVPGEGVLNNVDFVGTPSSPLRGTSPARGEVNGGFTLIELLVVVLIIGILAAVAVPQYQKAVYKSHYSKLKVLVKAITDAEEVYYLANGNYTADISALDVDWAEIPSEVKDSGDQTGKEYVFKWGYCSINMLEGNERVVCEDTFTGMRYRKIFSQSTNEYAGMQACTGLESKPATVRICQQESGKIEADNLAGLGMPNYYW